MWLPPKPYAGPAALLLPPVPEWSYACGYGPVPNLVSVDPES